MHLSAEGRFCTYPIYAETEQWFQTGGLHCANAYAKVIGESHWNTLANKHGMEGDQWHE